MDTVYNYIELIADTKEAINGCFKITYEENGYGDVIKVIGGGNIDYRVEYIEERAKSFDIASMNEEIITYCHGHKKLMNVIITNIRGQLESAETSIVMNDEDWNNLSTNMNVVSVFRIRQIITRLEIIKEEIFSTLDKLLVPESVQNPHERQEPQQNNIHTGNEDGLYLPSELDTERARKYFLKALEAKYIVRADTRYKWLYGGDKGQIRLGYFCSKVFPRTNDEQRPIKKLEELFGVDKLSSSISTAETMEPKRQGVKEWMQEIDRVLFAD